LALEHFIYYYDYIFYTGPGLLEEPTIRLISFKSGWLEALGARDLTWYLLAEKHYTLPSISNDGMFRFESFLLYQLEQCTYL
jgi:hypothetical protein